MLRKAGLWAGKLRRMAVDLRAQFGDAIFIGELHVGLPADQPGEDILAKGEIGAGGDRPHAHDDQSADDDPERHRPETDLAAGMNQSVIGERAGVLAAEVARDGFGRTLAGRGGVA